MTNTSQRRHIRDFVSRWTGRGYERGESQAFWLDLLALLGVESPAGFIRFESQVHLDHTSFIDGFIPATHVLIEQKSLGKDLRSPIRQSDGTLLTPFRQAKRYAAELPYSERPRWIVTCNFQEFLVYDMERPDGEPASILLKDLERELYRLGFLTKTQDATLQREMELSLQAGELVGRLYDALLAEYIDSKSPATLHSLNALCVRLVFCLYAEDAGLFGSHTAFHDYLASFNPENVRDGLIALFKILDTKTENRDPYARQDLLAFPYVNGGLFRDERIEIPRFTPAILHLLLRDCSADFDWSGISPTIFGAVFESTLNPETRRSGGMHYTSIENIHKVIDPLFLDGLTEEIDTIERIPQPKRRNAALLAFQQRLASLRFLDPACGSGNFLTETFLSLRRLENRALKLLRGDSQQISLGGDFSPIKVSISQFYGIELNDFAATVAKTALWIAESQMMQETEDIVGRDLDFLPLKTYTHITEGNALRLDWRTLGAGTLLSPSTGAAPTNNNTGTRVPPLLSPANSDTTGTGVSPLPPLYIMGNPPFVGARLMSKEQKDDMLHVFGAKWKNVGNMDYVTGWYKKAADLMRGTSIRAALVSTNSICQGEQVPNLWKPLMADGVHIDFAYRTFRWDSEAKLKAHVHCVIVGFSFAPATSPYYIYDGDAKQKADNINGYLIDADNVFIERRTKPLCDVPEMCKGSQPTDGGNLIIEADDYKNFIRKEPKALPFIRPFVGAEEFINHKQRYCLWLKGASPAQLRSMPLVMERIRNVREKRLLSPKAATRKCADTPALFQEIRQPRTSYLLVPSVSSERRRYIPIGYMPPEAVASNLVLIIPRATLYHFGVLTSSVHMAWMRAVCGRLKSDYRYSKDVVYNNFPWPAGAGTLLSPTDKAGEGVSPLPRPTGNDVAGTRVSPLLSPVHAIAQTAQGILDARALYPDSSLADLYDETLMPPELRKAHQANDRAVLAAYGFPAKDFSESDIVAALMRMYQALTQ